jgi:hypothetical protein
MPSAMNVESLSAINGMRTMSEINRNLICRVGVDLAKRVHQVHAVDGFEKVVLARSLSPDRFLEWCQSLQPGCVVAMESCSDVTIFAVASPVVPFGEQTVRLSKKINRESFVMPA